MSTHSQIIALFLTSFFFRIYLILDINNPFQSLARHHPADSYNTGYLNHIFGIVDAFKGYPNLLGFFAGNEVVNDAESAKISPPYVRAIIRDLKDYIALHANRTIPVGYSAADDKDLRTVMLQYLECQSGTNDTSAADFYGLNSYEWCSGRDDWQSSGYGNLLNDFKDTSIPIFLSEYGCNLNSPRTFDEVYDGLYANLSQVFSGGLVYEYAQEANDYGLVEINDDGNIKIDQDYSNLQAAYNKISLKTEYAADVPNTDRPICNSSYSKMITDQNSDFNASFSLPPCPNATFLQQGGGNSNIGKIIELKNNTSSYKIYNLDGNAIVNTTVEFSASDQINSPAGLSIGNAQSNSSDTESPSSTSSVVSSETAASSTSTSKAGADTLEYRGTGLFALLCGVAFML